MYRLQGLGYLGFIVVESVFFFEEFSNLLFEGSKFESISEFQFQSQNNLSKIPKSPKPPKSYLHQTRGHMCYFKNN